MAKEDKPEYCSADCVAIPDGVDAAGNLLLSIDLRPIRLVPQPATGGIGFSDWPKSVSTVGFLVEASSDGKVWKPVSIEPEHDDKAFRQEKYYEAGAWMWWEMFTQGLTSDGKNIAEASGEIDNPEKPDAKGAFIIGLDYWSHVGAKPTIAEMEGKEAPPERIEGYSYSRIAGQVHEESEHQAARALFETSARVSSEARTTLLGALEGDARGGVAYQIDAPFDPAHQITDWRRLAELFPEADSMARGATPEAEKGIFDTVKESVNGAWEEGRDRIGGFFASEPSDPLKARLARLYASETTDRGEAERAASEVGKLYRHLGTDAADARADEDDPPPPTLEDQVIRRLTALQAHPTLRKLFHLIADIKIKPKALADATGNGGTTGLLRVRVKREDLPDVAPNSETKFRYNEALRLFEPASEYEGNSAFDDKESRIPLRDGVVALQAKGRFGFEVIDAIASTKKLASQAVSTLEAHRSGEDLNKIPTEKPAPRTRGIMLLDRDATKGAERAKAREGRVSKPRRLYAEDLLSGFRPIVISPSPKFDPYETTARKIVYPTIHTLLGDDIGEKPTLKVKHIYPGFEHRDYGLVTPTTHEIEEKDAAGNIVIRLSESEVLFTWTGDPLSIPSLRDDAKNPNVVFADKSDLPFAIWMGPAPLAKYPPLRRGAGYKFMMLACKPNGGSIPLALAETLVKDHALGDPANGNKPYVFRIAERVPAPIALVPETDALVGSDPASTPNEAADRIVVRSGAGTGRSVTRVLVAGAISRDAARQARLFDIDATYDSQLRGVYRYLKQTELGGFPPIIRKNTPKDADASAGYLFKPGSNNRPKPIYADPLGRNLGFGFRRGAVRPVNYSTEPPRLGFWRKGETPSNQTVKPVLVTVRPQAPSGGNYKLGTRRMTLGGAAIDVDELFVDIAPAEEVLLDIWSFGDLEQGARTQRYAGGAITAAVDALRSSEKLRKLMRLDDLGFDANSWSAVGSMMTGDGPSVRGADQVMVSFAAAAEALQSRERLAPYSEMTTLTLVHAVRQPMERPRYLDGGDGLRFVRIVEENARSWGTHIGTIQPRDVGDARAIPDQAHGFAAYAVGAFKVHRPSTGAASLRGGWHDHGAPEALTLVKGTWVHQPVFRSLSVEVPDIPRRDDGLDASRVDLLRDDNGSLRGIKVHIDTGDAAPDTIARRVAVRLVATSRFVDYFPKNQGLDFTLGSVDEASGDGAIEAALTRPAPNYSPSLVTFWMPATRRPARPRVTEEVLIRQFVLDPDDNGRKMRATFRVVRRLYLGNKWFSSGEGEKLAMLLLPGDQFPRCPAAPTNRDKSAAAAASASRDTIQSLIDENRAEAWMKPYITQWGGDLTMRSTALTTDLPQSNFVSGWSEKCGGLRLPSPDADLKESDANGTSRDVSILAFTPRLDTRRGEWYCDIEVDANLAYTAMVRLGLAVYQPHAIKDQELSLPIALEPYPLQPRWDVLVQRTGDVMEIQVTGAGYSERAPAVAGLEDGDTAEVLEQVKARTQTPNLQFRLCYADTGIQVIDGGEPVVDVRLAPDSSSGGRPVWVGKLAIPAADRALPLRVHVAEMITHANAEAAIEGSGASPLVTVPTSFAFDTTMPPLWI